MTISANGLPTVQAPAVTVAGIRELVVPALIGNAGERATMRYVEFFTVTIRNPNTRAAYARACSQFLAWCEGLALPAIQPVHVAAWVEGLGQQLAAPTVKQQLAAVRMLFDWLVVGQIVPTNPAAHVRGPSHVVSTGKTAMPTREEAKALLAGIPTDTLIGLRDRALVATLFYTFSRVSAVTGMRVEDYYPVGKQWWLRRREKGGKEHAMPANPVLQDYLDAYIEAAGIAGDRKGPFFRSAAKRSGQLTDKAMSRADVYRMIQRRAEAAGLDTRIGCHSWRARGITAYLENGGLLEHAQQMAAHSSARTTKLYDRRGETVSAEEVGKIWL
jgi:site-specific recombinase XerD